MNRNTNLVVAVGAGALPLERWRAFAEACHRFSPRVVLREGEALFLDLRGIAFERQALEARIRVVAERLGVAGVRAIFAPCAWMAFAALKGKEGLGALDEVLAPFAPSDELARVARKMRETLPDLGLFTLADVARRPVGELGARFGSHAEEARRRILGSSDPTWPVFRMPERIVETEDFEAVGLCESLEGLMFPLRALADRAMARLRGRGERASCVRVRLRLERGAPQAERRWEIRLPVPQGAVGGVLPILRERLFFDVACKPLMARVSALRFEVSEGVPGRGAQRDFFSQVEEQQEALESLVGRLDATLGEGGVFRARAVERHLPESAWVRLSREEAVKPETVRGIPRLAEALPERGRRPTRLLERPVQLAREGDSLRAGRKRWEARAWEGPERVATEWWKGGAGTERDYFRVRTSDGELLWVFAQESRLFLHGYFD